MLRSALLGRVRRVRPKIVALSAPAGYGKSTFVAQLLDDAQGVVTCDCAQARDDLRIARAIVPELARDLEDGSRTAAERVERALAAWSATGAGFLVVEHLEHLTEAARETLLRFLAARPSAVTIVLVSRCELPFTLSRFAAPHEILTLRPADLAFTVDEVATLLKPDGGAEHAAQVTAFTRGWPAAVLLAKRLAAEGRLAAAAARLDTELAVELREYLAVEIVPQIDALVVQGLATCAALPEATLADLHLAFPDAPVAEALAAAAPDSAFLTCSPDGSVDVHPIVAAYARSRAPGQGRTIAAELARAYEGAGNTVRAAVLALASGDAFEAARLLARHDILYDRALPHGYLRVLNALDAPLVQRYPRLWAVGMLLRMYREDARELLDEAELVWRTLPLDASIGERYLVAVLRIGLMSSCGRPADAEVAIDAFTTQVEASGARDAALRERTIALRGAVRARAGALASAERDLHVSLAHMDEHDIPASGAYIALGADIARVRGERALERRFLDLALERAQRSRLENYAALPLAEAVFGAWFAGEESRMYALLDLLEEIVERSGVRAFAELVAAARGRSYRSTRDLPRVALMGDLLSLTHVRDDEQRREIARRAVADAAASGVPFMQALAHVAEAICDDAEAERALAAAAEIASRCESPALEAAIAALRAGEAQLGMLGAFLAAIDRSRSQRPAPIALEVLSGRVRIAGTAVRVSAREFELLAAIAARREGAARARLAAHLWPDVDDVDARNALNVLLHRLRGHLGRGDLIERDGDLYRLHRDAYVDLWEIERAAVRARTRTPLGDRDRARFAEILRGVAGENPEIVGRWEWFASQRRALATAQSDIFTRLANDALESGRCDEALAYARGALSSDPCDEAACEIAIRAHRALGDRGEARRTFLRYRDALARELGAEPSPALAKLAAS